MENLIKEILTNNQSRDKSFLVAFMAITFTVGHPWG